MNPDNCEIYVIIYVNKAIPGSANPQQNSQTAQPDGRRKQKKGGIVDKSVKRDKTVGERSAAHLVRHLVSALSVIIATVEAGL